MSEGDEIILTAEDCEAIRMASPLKVPPKTGIFAGARYLLSVKVGGETQLSSVMCKGGPYVRELGGGRKALYVDVFGYGIKDSVNIKKLRVRPEVQGG